jgi:hypothetical protein
MSFRNLCPEERSERGRVGGLALAAKRRAAREVRPFPGTILDAMDAAGMSGPTWAPWRTWWRAVYALPMDEDDLILFRQCTWRNDPPVTAVREAWNITGRRGGKSRSDALTAMFSGARTIASYSRRERAASFP